jgi:enoyl-CoA hydratase
MNAHPQTAGRIFWEKDQQIARVWIDHSEHLNALSTAMWAELRDVFHEIAADHSLRAAVIRGVGGAFAAGADISEFNQARKTVDQVRTYHEGLIAPALAAIVHCPIPVVAAIHGPCVGGGLEIATVCDLRIASDESRFGIPINRLGFPFAPAEAAGLVSLVGRAVSLELLLEGRIMNAQEAYEKGLISRCVATALWADEVESCLSRIIAGAPAAARRNKWLIHVLSELKDREILSPMQREACWDFALTKDYQRGLDAFANKTKPVFEDD